MKKKEEIKLNPQVKELTKYPTWLDADKAWRTFNYANDPKMIERIIYTMYKFFERPDAETLMDFCEEYKIHRDRLWDMSKTNPHFEKHFRAVKLIIANKDVKGVKHRRFEKDIVMKYLHVLDDEWDKINHYHNDLKKDVEGDKDSVKYIVIREPKLPDEALEIEIKNKHE